ncbi:hypothetical protein XENTR_v10020965 [Xenopus tropicalis]|nr:hypothetical protein XENTR_v10020965 [Xenopus tropicalis]
MCMRLELLCYLLLLLYRYTLQHQQEEQQQQEQEQLQEQQVSEAEACLTFEFDSELSLVLFEETELINAINEHQSFTASFEYDQHDTELTVDGTQHFKTQF